MKGLADGTLFPRLQELSLVGRVLGSRITNGLIEEVTDGLRAREAVGTYPPLTSLHVYSHNEHTQALQGLLSLQSCSKKLTSIWGSLEKPLWRSWHSTCVVQNVRLLESLELYGI